MFVEVLKADKKYRARLFAAYLVVAIAVFAAIRWGVPWFREYLQNVSIHKAFRILETVTIVFLLSFIGPAVYLIRFGRKIIRHQCVPFPGMKVIRDTPVKRGQKAISVGKVLVVLGIASIAFAVAGSAATHLLLKKIKSTPVKRALFFVAGTENLSAENPDRLRSNAGFWFALRSGYRSTTSIIRT
jgi:hypothetical protein